MRTLSVSGTVVLKQGWTVAVNCFTKDEHWIANSKSSFSCHMLKFFVGDCKEQQATRAFAKVFAFMEESAYNNSNVANATTLASPRQKLDLAVADDGVRVTHTFICAFMTILAVTLNLWSAV